jgi:hypothetical protein
MAVKYGGQQRKGTVVEAIKAVEATLMNRRSLYLHTRKKDEESVTCCAHYYVGSCESLDDASWRGFLGQLLPV